VGALGGVRGAGEGPRGFGSQDTPCKLLLLGLECLLDFKHLPTLLEQARRWRHVVKVHLLDGARPARSHVCLGFGMHDPGLAGVHGRRLVVRGLGALGGGKEMSGSDQRGVEGVGSELRGGGG
jgi:hypothetical protein